MASKHETSGLSTVSTLTPEVKAKYFPDEVDNDYKSENLEYYQVTSLGGKGAYVRKRPNINSKILATYSEGTVFSGDYSDKPNWIRIINNGKVVGYIHDENVSPYIECGEYYDNDNYTDDNCLSPSANNNTSSKVVEKVKESAKDIKDPDGKMSESIHKKKHFHFYGYMTDNEGDHPIELDFDARDNEISNVIYKNVTLGGKIRMKCTSFSGDSGFIGSFSLFGKDGPKDFIMNVIREDNDSGCYSGTSSVGTKHLTVTLYQDI